MTAAMTVTVLGSSGSYASVDNPCTGFLVSSADANVLFDCGPGTTGPLQAAIDLDDLTAIVVSHCHPDHWLELPVLRNVFTWFHPRNGIPLHGTAETRRMDEAVTVRAPGAPPPFEWQTIDESSTVVIGDQTWTFDRTDHPVETLAARVEVGDRAVMFTSDSGPGWRFDDFGRDVDLAFCDASHLEHYEGQGIPHMSAREAAERADAAGVHRLVLTHLIPGSDPVAHRAEAIAAYGGPVDVALPGCVFEI
ncbi:MAG: MBL fold metallo-hydrolase [Acidimicrobiales bacterium]|nr:MBL fold metallo-hydrolase [Acidimicrobiales bacterium]